jgi:hypothetical protein
MPPLQHTKEMRFMPTHRKRKEEESDEDPYIMAYIRWRKAIEPFIQADGSVVEQPGYYDQVLKDAINAQAKKTRQAVSPVQHRGTDNEKSNYR